MKDIKGKVWRFGNNIDTDLIIAARYLMTSDPKELAKHIMEDADPEFVNKLNKGDIIVAGENFGSGSSREHAPIALKEAGVGAIIAPSFARIFYRNAFNMGLPIFELKNIKDLKEGNEINISPDNGTIENLNTKSKQNFISIPTFMQELIDAGGLMEFAKKELQEEK